MDKIANNFPDLYKNVFPDFFNNKIPFESMAICEPCGMVKKGRTKSKQGYSVDPVFKCCTFYPFISNYTVGAILKSKSKNLEAGRAILKNIITEKIGVTPAGSRIIPSLNATACIVLFASYLTLSPL